MNICIQTGDLIPEFGIQTGYRLIREAGFDAIDFNIDQALSAKQLAKGNNLKDLCIFEKPLPEVLEYYDPQLKEIRANGLKISQAHAPFPAYLPGREDTLTYSIQIYKRIIEFCHAIECKNLVIHGITLEPDPQKAMGDTPQRIQELNMRLYSSLIDTLKTTNVTVCLENLFRSAPGGNYFEGVCSNPYEAAEAIDTLNAMAGKECFGLCLDTGHLNLLGKRFYTYVPILGKRIQCLHIHDNAGHADSHLAPYSGTIIWNDFIEELRKIGYDHDLNFETFAQVRLSKMDAELVPTFLKLIYDIGVFFRKKITES